MNTTLTIVKGYQYFKIIYLVAIGATMLAFFKASVYSYFSAGFLNIQQLSFYYLSSAVVWCAIIPVLVYILNRIHINSYKDFKQLLIILAVISIIAVGQRFAALMLDFYARDLIAVFNPDSRFALENGAMATLSIVKNIVLSSSLENFIILGVGVTLYYRLIKTRVLADALRIQLKNGTFLSIKDIEIIKANKNYIELLTANESYTERITLKALSKKIGGSFIRVHRSHLINRSVVRSIEPLYHKSFKITTTSGRWVSSSPNYFESVNSLKSRPI